MAKVAVKTASKKAPAPSTVFEHLMAAILAEDASFKAQGAKESADDFFRRLVESIANIDEDTWGEVDEDAQAWFNKAVKALNNDNPVPACEGFTPTGKGAKAKAAPEPEEDDEEEAPKPKKKAKAPVEEEEEEEEPAPKKKAKKAPVEEEEEEEEPAPKAKKKAKVVEEEEEEEPAPKPKKKAKAPEPEEEEEEEAPKPKKKAKVAEPEDDDAEEEAPKKKPFGGKQAAPFAAKPDGVTFQIRLAIAKNPEIEASELKAKISKRFPDVKTATITTLLGDVKATIRAIKAAGHWED